MGRGVPHPHWLLRATAGHSTAEGGKRKRLEETHNRTRPRSVQSSASVWVRRARVGWWRCVAWMDACTSQHGRVVGEEGGGRQDG